MASKSTRQTITLLAAASGALQIIKGHGMVGDPNIKASLEEAINLTNYAIENFPDSNTTYKKAKKDELWITDRMVAWQALIDELPQSFEFFTLVSIADQCLIDLVGKVRAKKKLALILPVLEPVGIISDFCDPTGRSFDEFECANDTLQKLYELIGFDG